ncbi:MAG: hypothetical protein K2X47_17145 [Bdellovibrionales bacterium]|nr:hypothetical protein [Bdellovibrionales bacterium]
MTTATIDRTRFRVRVQASRVVFGLSVLSLWTWGWFWLANTSPDSWVLGALAGVLITIPLSSLGEWATHGFLYHAPFPGLEEVHDIHHTGHHFTLFPPKNYVQTQDRFEYMSFAKPVRPFRMSQDGFENTKTKWAQTALHFFIGIPLILMPVWFFGNNIYFFASTLITLGFISWLLTHVHGCMHTPRNRAIEKQFWFRWLDRHHYIHHMDVTVNINFLLPICDVLFGTIRTYITPQEMKKFPSFVEAKVPASQRGNV